MPSLGWRYLLGLTSIPLFIFGIFCFRLPESARYNLNMGNYKKAVDTLNVIAKTNKSSLPEGNLIGSKKEVVQGKFRDLLSKEHRFTTIIIWIVWFANAFSYYGIVLLTTEM